jgi:hypothetical protein
MNKMKEMPIMYDRGYHFRIDKEWPKSIPFELLNEDWAKINHSQTLTRLAERGGMSPYEIYLNIQRTLFEYKTKDGFYQDQNWMPFILQHIQNNTK